MGQRDPENIHEERKVVTAVFADLVGSTAITEQLDPEEAKLLLGEAVARICRTVEGFGGTVKDLAGDGVLALFGAPVSHEDDPERAVRAGLRITEDIATYASDVERGWGIKGFSVRVGVDTGSVILGPVGGGKRIEYGAVGDAMNTASRLQAAATPGAVLVSSATKRLIEPQFDWSDQRDLTLKGKSASVPAFEVNGVRSGRRSRAVGSVQARLVGREDELEVGRDAVRAVLAGAGGVRFITGEAGIGKSRMLAELREEFKRGSAARGDGRWVEGKCVSYGEALQYWPFRDLIRDWLALTADEPELRVQVALRRQLERLNPADAVEMYRYIGAMLGLALEPEAAARLAELSPEALQYRTFEVVKTLASRVAEEGPLALILEDMHWSDPTSIQLAEALLPLAEEAPVLFIISARNERNHPSWRLKELAAREYPHVTDEIALQSLTGEADRSLLHVLIAPASLPPDLENRILDRAEGNPFYLEELARSLIDEGALVPEEDGWRFDHEVAVEVPATVEKVILARIDRLPAKEKEVLRAASVLGRQFGLPLLRAVADEDEGLREIIHDLRRQDLLREGRRWPEPDYRFKHALIQEAAYGTILAEKRKRLHRKAAEWLEQEHVEHEDEVAGLLAHHWTAASDEDKAVAYLSRAADNARAEYALDEAIEYYRALLPMMEHRGERQEIAIVWFKLALALHTSLRFKEANESYQRAFRFWERPPARFPGAADATLRVSSSFLPNDPDPKSAIAWPNIQLCMQLFDRLVEAWPERTIVPSLAERWEISEDGLRYVFHLREGLTWSDGSRLTAHDIEFGIKRVLDPERPGSSVAIYFVLENAQDYYLGRSQDPERVGVHALDDRTVEFRLSAPAPYFMSVMNRPDSGPQPRHAIEEHGDAWTDPSLQVVSGPFRQLESDESRLTLVRQHRYAGVRPGNVARIEYVQLSISEAMAPYDNNKLDLATVRYTPRLADLVNRTPTDVTLGPATWSCYLAFDHGHPTTSNVELRRALAHAIDRSALELKTPANLIVATGGVVPPALQGHTPDIVPSFDPELARQHLHRAGSSDGLAIAALEEWRPLLTPMLESWHEVLGLSVELRTWDLQQALTLRQPWQFAPIAVAGWLPGYPDPEYYLRLLLHSDSKTNEGGFAFPPFDNLIERARQERDGRARLELFHEADRMAVSDRIALIPLAYGRSMAFVKPWVEGWWEFGKTSTSFADLSIEAQPVSHSDQASHHGDGPS